RDFQIDAQMRDAFYQALSKKAGGSVDRDLFDDSRPYVDWLLGVWVANAAFGDVAQLQRRFSLDQQVNRSVALLSRASTPGELFALAGADTSRTGAGTASRTSGR
ncbi:MAG TPA: hypothetical protein VKA44_07270, partial [Gemmatimonadota bacterium]|nr:hypothetical protein [Gemmatimonadota bacterium]